MSGVPAARTRDIIAICTSLFTDRIFLNTSLTDREENNAECVDIAFKNLKLARGETTKLMNNTSGLYLADLSIWRSD